MTTEAFCLRARFGAIELVLESIYAALVMHADDPVSEARRWAETYSAGVRAALTREAEAEAEGAPRAEAAAFVEAIMREFDCILANVVTRVEGGGPMARLSRI